MGDAGQGKGIGSSQNRRKGTSLCSQGGAGKASLQGAWVGREWKATKTGCFKKRKDVAVDLCPRKLTCLCFNSDTSRSDLI